MSSSLMSEKLDKKYMVNFSSGNQKNINVSKFKFFKKYNNSNYLNFSLKTNLESFKTIQVHRNLNRGSNHLNLPKKAKTTQTKDRILRMLQTTSLRCNKHNLIAAMLPTTVCQTSHYQCM